MSIVYQYVYKFKVLSWPSWLTVWNLVFLYWQTVLKLIRIIVHVFGHVSKSAEIWGQKFAWVKMMLSVHNQSNRKLYQADMINSQ